MKVTDKYVFFWNGVFSQWYPSTFTAEGYIYNTAEQYMMHQKALLFGDNEIAEKIMQASRPDEQKALGRQVKNFNPTTWSKACLSIVCKGNYFKFTQNKGLQAQLLATGGRILVEASPYDQVWGIGMGEDEVGIEDPTEWKGQNLLGWALMLTRQEIRGGSVI